MKKISSFCSALALLPAFSLTVGCMPSTDYAMLSPTLQDEALRAEKGDVEAQFRMGWMYQNGLDDPKTNFKLPKNLSKAFYWYHKAAVHGDSKAEVNLGWLYLNGMGVLQSFSGARKWYEKAALKGNPKGAYALGLLYATAVGKQQNFAKAVYWLSKAAEQGFIPAEICLGYLYETMPPTPLTLTPSQARERAFDWYQKAAHHGYAKAQLKLGELYAQGRGVGQDAQKAFYWIGQAVLQGDQQARFVQTRLQAEAGDRKAQFDLGEMYRLGRGTRVNFPQAVKAYQESAWQDYPPAQYALGRLYAQGKGLREDRAWAGKAILDSFFPLDKANPEDRKKAITFLTRAAAQNNSQAQFALGVAYEYGVSVPEDGRRAIYFYQKAAEHGEAGAQLALANAYLGQNIKNSESLAGKLLEKAASQGLPQAQYKLGQLYEEGQRLWPQDLEKAVHYYRLSAEQNYLPANFALARMYEEGLGVAFNPPLAAQIYQKLADKNIPLAQYKLGKIYETGSASKDALEGVGLPRNYHLSTGWYRRSARGGSAEGQFALGMAEILGRGTAKIPLRGLYWIEKSAAQGNAQAQFTLGHAFIDKRLGLFNRAKAVQWFKKAADQGHAGAEFALALIYDNPDNHLYYDPKKAQDYFCKAAAQGIVTVEEVPEKLADTVMRNRKIDLEKAAMAQRAAIVKVDNGLPQ